MEIWKPIVRYEDCYAVSNLGRVKSLTRIITSSAHGKEIKYKKSGKILKLNYNKQNGYYNIHLWKNGVMRTYNIHFLVAQAFCDKPLNCECVNHKNGRKKDNRANNLEWVTYKENNQHAYDNKLKCAKSYKIYNPELNITFNSSDEAAKYIENHEPIKAKHETIRGNIRSCAKINKQRLKVSQKLKQCYKYHWQCI